MGHERMSEDVDELIRIATMLRGRIEEKKVDVIMLEAELRKVEDKIALKLAAQRGENVA